jgi:CheY-like chemotaxis protein
MGKKILLADDSITIQKVIELTFSDEDFEVVTVGNGRLAIERLEEVNPDIVLCDIIMPEKDGYEVCEHIKKHPTLSRVPVLLLTGAFEPFDQERANRVGCDGFLAKPFEPSMLIGKVKDLLAQAGSRPAAAAPPPAFDEPAVAVPRFEPIPAPGPLPGPAASFISDSVEEPIIEDFPTAAPSEESAPVEAASVLEEELYGDPVPTAEAEPEPVVFEASMTPEEAHTLSEPPESAMSSSTVMFRAGEARWDEPPQESEAPVAPAPAPVAEAMPAFDEVFEAELQAGVSEPEAEGQAAEGAVGSTIPFSGEVSAAAPEAEPVFDMGIESEAAAPVEPPAPTYAAGPPPAPTPPAQAAELAPPDLPEEVSFAEVAPAAAVEPRETEPSGHPSAAAEVAVPVDMVAQIAQRVVSQISEKMVREVAWEVIPDLAETLIRKEIERLKAELQNT